MDSPLHAANAPGWLEPPHHSVKAETYSYADLVGRLTDLKALACPPSAGEKASLASSYDRKSQYDGSRDKYIHWGANGDSDGIIRMEGDIAVMADIQGPGCIWRIWSARPMAGHVKIYLDRSTTPAVDLPFAGYFNGRQEPFNRPALVYTTKAEGYNNYTPIPFQKSCKIVAERGWGDCYHFNYSQFPVNTVVPTFRLPISAADAAALNRANHVLTHSGQNPNPVSSTDEVVSPQILAAPGKTTTVYDISGSGAITGLRVKFNLPGDIAAQRTLLRQVALRMNWDNQSDPAVWSPLGDFFGSPAAAISFDSLPAGLGKDGYWYSYWYMPFGTHATVSIDNDGATALPMEWEITRAKLPQEDVGLLRFHAKWHRDAFLPERADRSPDWTLLTTQGKGRFVGTQLHLYNARGEWWGEGDEKFFVDGEKFPSTFGTGSEDYFGYAWGNPDMFAKPFHGQPYKDADISKFRCPTRDGGHVSNFRWHISDNIPFQTSFEGALEKYITNERWTFYATVAYWYLDPTGIDPYPVVPVSERIGYCVRPPVYHEPNVIEAAELNWLNPTRASDPAAPNRGTADIYGGVSWEIPSDVTSNDSFRWIRIKDIGSKVEFSGLKVEKAGNYNLKARIFKAAHSGIYQFSVDRIRIGDPLDLYAARGIKESAMSSDNIFNIGNVKLAAGDHVFSIALVGNNENARADRSGRFEFCLDYVKLEAVH